MAVNEEAEEAARIIEQLTGIPPGGRRNIERKISRKEKREQAARVRRFLALSPELQEGALRYGEKIKKAYLGGGLTKDK
jgi:hypothetical protein